MHFLFSSFPPPRLHYRVAGAALFALLVGLSVWLYHPTLTLPPSFHHTWAQADWLALALNFRQRGFDLLHPATYNLLTRDGITGAALPLPAYLTALLMQLTGSEAPGQMRLLTLLLSLGGMLALFGLVLQASRSVWRAGLAALFAFCSPLYGYYQANYLPSVPAFAAALAGYYCLYRFSRPAPHAPPTGRWLYAAIALLTLAAAIRTPFAIPLLISLGHVLVLRRRQTALAPGWLRAGAAGLVALLFLGGYFLYNEHLTRAYGGSMFLARPRPFQSVAEAWDTTQLVADKWGLDLLSYWQWLALGAASLGAALSRRPRQWLRSEWLLHGLLLTAGGLAYYVLMGPQYIDHDYYFIDSLLLPLVLVFGGALASLRRPAGRRFQWFRGGALAIAGVLAVLWVLDTHTVQRQRYTEQAGDRGAATLRNFTGSARLLDSLGVPRAARIMVLDAYSFNLPLVLMQRRGWTVLTTSEANLRDAFRPPADLFVTQNAFFHSDIVTNYPLLLERLDSVYSNGQLTFWRPRRRPVPIVWQDSAGLEEPLDSTIWARQLPSRERALTGSFSSYLPADATYGLTFARPVRALGLRAHDRLVVRLGCWLPLESNYSAQLVVSMEPAQGGAPYYRRTLDCRRYQGPPNRWTIVGGNFTLPAPRQPNDVLKVYLMKEGPVALWLDDLVLTLVR